MTTPLKKSKRSKNKPQRPFLTVGEQEFMTYLKEAIDKRGEIPPQKQIAFEMDITQGMVSRRLAQLARKGYLRHRAELVA